MRFWIFLSAKAYAYVEMIKYEVVLYWWTGVNFLRHEIYIAGKGREGGYQHNSELNPGCGAF